MSFFASIGPANMMPRDNVTPGISRLFPLRLALRIAQMLRAIKRGGHPGVHRTDQVKTHGTVVWQGCGTVTRLIVPGVPCDYRQLAARAPKTRQQGSSSGKGG